GQAHEGRGLAGVPLVGAGQPTTAADPSQRPLDDPSLREHPEAGPVTAANDRTLPDAGPGDNRLHCATLIARITDDALQKRATPPGLPEQCLCTVAVLHAQSCTRSLARAVLHARRM